MVPLPQRVRSSCAALMAEAEFVDIEVDRLAALAEEYRSATAAGSTVVGDPRPVASIDADAALLVLALDAINFGSGYHDVVRKDPGLSGARTMASRLRAYVGMSGPLTAARLRTFTPADCSQIFGQELDGGALEELMFHFAVALNDLGSWLDTEFGGSVHEAMAHADRSAVAFAESLLAMPYYRDVERVDLDDGPLEVALYKRAQITAADLEREVGPGLFDDLGELTAFADNLVPHVLRIDGVLVLDPELEATINAGLLLEPGARPEVELRAAGVVVVDRLTSLTGHRAMDLDLMLWERGSGARYKAVPRHRARGVFY
ncbi:MAG: queuosine salvage family protein [Acidimicrobiales bacterium]